MLESFIAFIAVLLDQLSKLWVTESIKGADAIAVIPGVFSFRYVENTGAAFGMLGNMTLVLSIISAIIAVVMVVVIVKYRKSETLLFRIAAAMIIGGAIGNLIDRIALGYVVDFIELTFVDFAIFNVADCFVTVGTILLGIYIIFFYEKNKRRRLETAEVREMADAIAGNKANIKVSKSEQEDEKKSEDAKDTICGGDDTK